MYVISPFQYIYTFIKGHLAQKGLLKVTFPSQLQYLNGSLSKLSSLKVYFLAVHVRTFGESITCKIMSELVRKISIFLVFLSIKWGVGWITINF